MWCGQDAFAPRVPFPARVPKPVARSHCARLPSTDSQQSALEVLFCRDLQGSAGSRCMQSMGCGPRTGKTALVMPSQSSHDRNMYASRYDMRQTARTRVSAAILALRHLPLSHASAQRLHPHFAGQTDQDWPPLDVAVLVCTGVGGAGGRRSGMELSRAPSSSLKATVARFVLPTTNTSEPRWNAQTCSEGAHKSKGWSSGWRMCGVRRHRAV
jgi:hypothetical protein